MAEGRIERYRRQTREASGEVTGFLGEVFGAAQAVQLAGATPHAVRRLHGLGERRRRRLYETAASTSCWRPSTGTWCTWAPG